jgi:Ca2+/Na+ antiporter
MIIFSLFFFSYVMVKRVIRIEIEIIFQQLNEVERKKISFSSSFFVGISCTFALKNSIHIITKEGDEIQFSSMKKILTSKNRKNMI